VSIIPLHALLNSAVSIPLHALLNSAVSIKLHALLNSAVSPHLQTLSPAPVIIMRIPQSVSNFKLRLTFNAYPGQNYLSFAEKIVFQQWRKYNFLSLPVPKIRLLDP
jgi:hypothetical protein